MILSSIPCKIFLWTTSSFWKQLLHLRCSCYTPMRIYNYSLRATCPINLIIHFHSRNNYLLHTYLLTPMKGILLEKLTGFQLVKKFPAFYGTRRFITAFTSARHLSLSSAISFQPIPPHPTSWRLFLILSSHLSMGIPSGLVPSGFHTKTLYTPLLSPIHATCSAHLILLDFITRKILGEEYRSLRSSWCSFLHSLVASSFLGPNIPLNTLFSKQ